MPIDPRANDYRRRCRAWLDWYRRVWIIITNWRKDEDSYVYFPERIINRPDPCVYSQFLLMQLHQPVTWDDPDSVFRAFRADTGFNRTFRLFFSVVA